MLFDSFTLRPINPPKDVAKQVPTLAPSPWFSAQLLYRLDTECMRL